MACRNGSLAASYERLKSETSYRSSSRPHDGWSLVNLLDTYLGMVLDVAQLCKLLYRLYLTFARELVDEPLSVFNVHCNTQAPSFVLVRHCRTASVWCVVNASEPPLSGHFFLSLT